MTSGFRLELSARCLNTYWKMLVKGIAASWGTQKKRYVGYLYEVLTIYIYIIDIRHVPKFNSARTEWLQEMYKET